MRRTSRAVSLSHEPKFPVTRQAERSAGGRSSSFSSTLISDPLSITRPSPSRRSAFARKSDAFMTDRPIIFSALTVRAPPHGRKPQVCHPREQAVSNQL